MPLSLLIGVLTLVPALAAILIAGVGAARRPLAPAIFVLCALGALVPVVGLLMLVPYLGDGEPLRVALFGGSLAPSIWFSAVYRIDAFGVYAGLGLAILVVPLLLWMAWKGRLAPALPAALEPVTAETAEGAEGAEVVAAKDDDMEQVTASESVDKDEPSAAGSMLPARSWAGVALALAAESAALTVLLADNILWLALAWLVLAALVWATGELGAEEIDRVGLALMLAGPVLWAIVMLTGAVPVKAATLFDLMGRGAYSVVQIILLGLVLALAGGAYPFLTWVRRRAALATPAGLGALVLVLLPIALFTAARTYAAAADINGQWAQIGQAAPPVYGGIAWAVLGTATIVICGLLALERRDTRTLIAYLGVAQMGWGMLALSTGDPASLPGVILLLTGAVFGLGAMLAAVFAGATLTDDEELDGAGPSAFGTRSSPAALFAWCAGAVSLIGVPLFGGFAARELISAAALHLGNLTVPLVGIAWAGDALLALALLRATAPAFTRLMSDGEIADDENYENYENDENDEAGEDETLAAVAAGTTADDEGFEDEDGEGAEDDGTDVDADADETDLNVRAGKRQGFRGDIRALPALIFGLLAIALGIAPQVLLGFFGGTLAASILGQAHAVDRALRLTDVGYTAGFAQWLPSLAWGAVIVLALVFTFTRPDSLRVARLPVAEPAESHAADEAAGPELAGLAEPKETWRELGPIFVSPVMLPAGRWLLADTDLETVEPAEAATGDEKSGDEAEVATEAPTELPKEDAAESAEEAREPVKVTASAAASFVVAKSDESAPAEDNSHSQAGKATVAPVDGPDDAGDAQEKESPVTAAKPAISAAKPVAKRATSQSATPPAKSPAQAQTTKPKTPETKAAAPTSKTDGATKPTAGGKPAAKSTAPASGTKVATPTTTKPAPGKPSGQAKGKSGGPSSKPGSKKQPGGRP